MNLPRVLTERDAIRTVAERWKQQYLVGGDWKRVLNGKSDAIHARLAALDVETATAADVAEVVGNTSWVGPTCDGCGEYVAWAVEVGDAPDYESRTAVLCAPCLRAAYALLGMTL